MPSCYDVHRGAADPKTAAKKLCLQQLLLGARTDSVSLSTVFKNSVNFKSATDACLQP